MTTLNFNRPDIFKAPYFIKNSLRTCSASEDSFAVWLYNVSTTCDVAKKRGDFINLNVG